MLDLSEVRPGDTVRRKPDGLTKMVLKVDGNFIYTVQGGFYHFKHAEIKSPMGWLAVHLDFQTWLGRVYDNL